MKSVQYYPIDTLNQQPSNQTYDCNNNSPKPFKPIDAIPNPKMAPSSKPNLRGDKYSLRPRIIRSTKCDETEVNVKPNGNLADVNGPSPANPTKIPKSKYKPKQKPAPLSKYRRKTANARERSRMREINTAFETLRKAVPQLFIAQCPNNPATSSTNEKLTKITTLRLAMRYISALSSALKGPQKGPPAPKSGYSLNNNNFNVEFLVPGHAWSESPLLYSQITQTPSAGVSQTSQMLSDFTLDLDTFLGMESSDADSLCTISDNSFTLSDQPLTPPLFDDQPLCGDTSAYFNEQGLGLEFNDHSLSPDFSDSSSLSPIDQFLSFS